MGSIAGEKKPAEAHRLGDKAAQRRNALFDRRTGLQAIARLLIQPRLQFLPEALIRPGFDILREAALDVIAAARRRAHRAERKAKRMTNIDQLVGNRRRVRQDAEPAERIDPLMRSNRGRRQGLAADAGKAVAAGDEIAQKLLFLPVGAPTAARPPMRSLVISVWP